MLRRFFSVSFCIAWLLVASPVFGMAPEYRAAMHAALLTLYYEHPEYALGGGRATKTTDCSELIRQAMELAGISGTDERTQAWIICMGKAPAYLNKPVKNWKTGDNEECDIICQHIKGGLDRPYGINHIIAIIVWNGVYHVIHASDSKKAVVIIPLAAWIEKSMIPDGYRRFIIGDTPSARN